MTGCAGTGTTRTVNGITYRFASSDAALVQELERRDPRTDLESRCTYWGGRHGELAGRELIEGRRHSRDLLRWTSALEEIACDAAVAKKDRRTLAKRQPKDPEPSAAPTLESGARAPRAETLEGALAAYDSCVSRGAASPQSFRECALLLREAEDRIAWAAAGREHCGAASAPTDCFGLLRYLRAMYVEGTARPAGLPYVRGNEYGIFVDHRHKKEAEAIMAEAAASLRTVHVPTLEELGRSLHVSWSNLRIGSTYKTCFNRVDEVVPCAADPIRKELWREISGAVLIRNAGTADLKCGAEVRDSIVWANGDTVTAAVGRGKSARLGKVSGRTNTGSLLGKSEAVGVVRCVVVGGSAPFLGISQDDARVLFDDDGIAVSVEGLHGNAQDIWITARTDEQGHTVLSVKVGRFERTIPPEGGSKMAPTGRSNQ